VVRPPAGGRDGAEPRADAAGRSVNPGDAPGVRQITICRNPGDRGLSGVAPACRHGVNQKCIRRLMRLMCVRRENSPSDCFLNLLTGDLPEAQHQQAEKGAQDLHLSDSGGLRVDRPGQGLKRRHHHSADAAHAQGSNRWRLNGSFLYPGAIMDWFTCKVLAWRKSNAGGRVSRVEAPNETIHRYGAPGIMNTDQGSRCISCAWTDRLSGSAPRS
jgi:putative transposase